MNLEFLRKANNLSQEELSRLAGVSQGYISAMERGVRQPTLPIIKKLATALGISLAEFLGETSLNGKEDSHA